MTTGRERARRNEEYHENDAVQLKLYFETFDGQAFN